MPASEARIAANRQNAARSTGPKTPEGKERSRANALKHGLTGEGVVLPSGDAEEVERRAASFRSELRPSGEVGETLVRRAALMAVRMERCADREIAETDARVRRALDEFEAPEGVDALEAERLRAQAGQVARFDPSKEASLARRYEAAAERGFFRALKELRQVERAAGLGDPSARPSAAAVASAEALASFSRFEKQARAIDPRRPSVIPPTPNRPSILDELAGVPPFPPRFDVPIAIGRRR